MKKALIIACYMGILPKWINAWIVSCANNKYFDFMLVTDDIVHRKLPSNVYIERMSFQELKSRFQKEFEFKISLEKSYKICDYKPIYGLAFSDYLKGYEFWGHCDVDMIFGDISNFFTCNLLKKYDRLGTFGHLILYKNYEKINYLYRKKGAAFSYKEVFTKDYSYNFDERYGYNMLCDKNSIKWLDCKHKYCLDKRYGENLYFTSIINYPKQYVVWNNGKIYHVFLDDKGCLKKQEKMYFHFSKTDYEIPEKADCIIFGSNFCKEINPSDLYIYLKNISEKTYKPDFKYNKWSLFKKRSLYHKYIYIRQKVCYYFLEMLKRWRITSKI